MIVETIKNVSEIGFYIAKLVMKGMERKLFLRKLQGFF